MTSTAVTSRNLQDQQPEQSADQDIGELTSITVDRGTLLDARLNDERVEQNDSQIRLTDSRDQIESLRTLSPDDRVNGIVEILRSQAQTERVEILENALNDGIVTGEEADLIRESLRDKDLEVADSSTQGATRLGALLNFREYESERTLEKDSNISPEAELEQEEEVERDREMLQFRIAGVNGSYVVQGNFQNGVFEGAIVHEDGETRLKLDRRAFNDLGEKVEVAA